MFLCRSRRSGAVALCSFISRCVFNFRPNTLKVKLMELPKCGFLALSRLFCSNFLITSIRSNTLKRKATGPWCLSCRMSSSNHHFILGVFHWAVLWVVALLTPVYSPDPWLSRSALAVRPSSQNCHGETLTIQHVTTTNHRPTRASVSLFKPQAELRQPSLSWHRRQACDERTYLWRLHPTAP